jgi:ABC-type nitrate/sulfonate/bicarbonate transport system ATPase subunit
MKIRVSLARAMIADTKLWLLDEPFASLDEELRKRMISRLRAWIKERGISVICVTHFEDDATLFADRIYRF